MIGAQKVLHIEDNPGDADIVKEILYSAKGSEFDILHVERLSAALSELQKKKFDVILLDLGLPDSSGIQTVKEIHDSSPHVPIVVITGNNDEALGMNAVKNGAQDYLVKGLIPGFHMVRVLQYAIQRKKTDEKIRRSEQFLRSSLDGLSAHIAIINHTGDIITVNKAWNRFANNNGTPPNKVWENFNYLEVCDRAANTGAIDAKKFVSGIRSVITGQKNTFEMDYPCHSPDKKRWFHGKVTPFPDNALPYVIIVHENITERELSKKNLQRSKEKFRSIVDNLNVGIFRNTVGPKDKIIEANPAIAKMFGSDNRDDFLKVDVFDLYKNRDDREKFISKLLKTGTVRNEELYLQTLTGISFIGSISAVVVKDKKNKVKYIDGIIEDITDRKKVESALIESEEKYRTILEANPDPVVIYDMEGRVIYFNPAFTKIFGWSLEECLGERMDRFVPDEASAETKMMIGKVRAGKEFYDIETSRYNKKKELIPISISGAIYKDPNGNPIGSVINLKDLSYQKKMEAQLRQSQKMEAIGTLAGGIAHDFNNILTAILGFSSLIKMDHPEEPELHEDVSDIEIAAHRASELVNQILTFCRRKETEFKPIRIDIIIKEALKLLRSTIPATIEIKTAVERTNEFVLADPTQIHQIIMNLCTNASHAMQKEGGTLEVNLSSTKSKLMLGFDSNRMQTKNFLELKVKDTGYGIPEDIIDNIFDPYFTTKNLGEGTGLGLSVVQGIIKTFGGEITVESKPGKGTEFTILFPVADREEDQNTSDEFIKIEGGNEKILLIDDERPVLKFEQRILRNLGYNVTTENDSEKAFEKIKRDPKKFDLVITDMTMPKMDGVTLAKQAMRVNPDLAIIICTGYSNLITKEKSRYIGVKALIYKPLSIPIITSEIRKIFDQKEKK